MSTVIYFSIADSDFYFKEIMVQSLLRNPFYKVVKNCNNGHELIKQLYLKQESVFLIDLYMPIISGLEAIKFIRKSGNKTPIIAYSSTFQEDMHTQLASIDDVFYCQKKSEVINEVLKNYVFGSRSNYLEYLKIWEKQSIAVIEYMERQKRSWYEPSLIEIQIMKLCYEGLSNKEIGQYLDLSGRTIDTYITNLNQKLGLRNKIDLIRFCVEQGYYNSST